MTAVAPTGTVTRQRVCPLCEATCGLNVALDRRSGEVVGIRGDPDHVFSRGYICPKAVGVMHLERDPDRLTRPLVRRDGELVETDWDAAFEAVAAGLSPILEAHGRDALAVYLGNPNVHNLAGQLYLPVLVRAMRSHNVYSASTVDQRPKELASGLMYGTGLSIAIADVDNTQFLVMLGANPMESNGSLLTAPDMRGRLRALRRRGGRLVVVDPRRTRTAEEADQHIPIRPGTDAHLLAAMATTIIEEGLARPGRLLDHVAGYDRLQPALAPFTPERVAAHCGVDAGTIRGLARDLAAAGRGVVYGRIGTTTQRFGTVASWLVDVLNILTGNLDREGGALFPLAAAGSRNASGPGGTGRGARMGRFHSRVRGLPETFGELPVACLAEEIDTDGDERVRALITVAGNPVLSTPNGARLRSALDRLDFMVSVDIYRNETSGVADVVLPVPGALRRGHYDLAFTQLSVRNVACYSPPVLPPEPGVPDEWEILLRLAAVVQGLGPNPDVAALDDLVARTLAEREAASCGVDAARLLAATEPWRGPERLLDLLLRTGPYGEFGRSPWPSANGGPDGLRLDVLVANPHGIDLGPLRPRLPEVLRTPSGRIEVAPQPILDDLDRLGAALEEERGSLVLIGRRDLRSNNSWMHNVEVLARGPERCTLMIHPDDARRAEVEEGGMARVRSRAGTVVVGVEVTDSIMPGVVSIPHGYGHDDPSARQRVAAAHAGVNVNLLVDEREVDALSGNAVLNGVPVSVEPEAG